MSTRSLPVLALLSLAACADMMAAPGDAVVRTGLPAPPPVAAQTLDPTPPPPPPAAAVTVEEFDTTTEEDRAAALAPPDPAQATDAARLGTTIASLGPPGDPGIWMETPLVDALTPGRVEYEGASVNVELRPSGGEPGSGSQISLAAMRLLGAPLTGLPELVVYRN